MKKITGYLVVASLLIFTACQVSYAAEKQVLLGEREVLNIPGKCAQEISRDITVKKEAVAIKEDLAKQAIKETRVEYKGSGKVTLRDKGDKRIVPPIEGPGGAPINKIAPKPDLPTGPRSIDPEILRRLGYTGPKEAPRAPVFKPVIEDIKKEIKSDPIPVIGKDKLVSDLEPHFTGGAVMNITVTKTVVEDTKEAPVTGLAPKPDLPKGPQMINPDLLRRLGYAKPKGLGQAPIFKPEIKIIEEEKPETDRNRDIDRVTSPVKRPYEFGGGAVLRGTVTIDRQAVE